MIKHEVGNVYIYCLATKRFDKIPWILLVKVEAHRTEVIGTVSSLSSRSVNGMLSS